MKQREFGFTLVEVMVALAVVALALPALLLTLHQQIDSTAYLRDKSIARLVANNKLVEYRLLAKARNELPKEKDSGVMSMAQREWYWRTTSVKTQVPGFVRTTVSVATREEGLPILTLSAFFTATAGSAQ